MFQWIARRAEEDRKRRTERWWIVFTDKVEIGIFRLFTRPGRRHCFAFRQLEPGLLLFIDPCRDRTFTVAVRGHPWPYVQWFLGEGHSVVVVNREFPPYSRRPKRVARRGPVASCAAIIAHELGLDRWVVTPQGLHRVLLQDFEGKELSL